MISLIPEKYKKFYNSNITDTLLEPDYNQLVLYIVFLYDTDALAKLFAYVINSSPDTAIPEFLDKLPIYLMTNNVANILCAIDSENLSKHPITSEQYDNERDVMNYCTCNSDIFTQRAKYLIATNYICKKYEILPDDEYTKLCNDIQDDIGVYKLQWINNSVINHDSLSDIAYTLDLNGIYDIFTYIYSIGNNLTCLHY